MDPCTSGKAKVCRWIRIGRRLIPGWRKQSRADQALRNLPPFLRCKRIDAEILTQSELPAVVLLKEGHLGMQGSFLWAKFLPQPVQQANDSAQS